MQSRTMVPSTYSPLSSQCPVSPPSFLWHICPWWLSACPSGCHLLRCPEHLTLLLFLGQIEPECVCVCVITSKPWPVRVRVRVTQGLSLSNSLGVIETNGLSFSILLGGHLDPQRGRCGALWGQSDQHLIPIVI